MNRYFTKEDIWMSYKHMERSLISLVITEMQIKTTKCYHYTAIKWIKKRREVKKGRKNRRKERKKGEGGGKESKSE